MEIIGIIVGLILLTAILVITEKYNHSYFVWGGFTMFLLFISNKILGYSVAFSMPVSGAITISFIYAFMLLDDSVYFENKFLRLFIDFDKSFDRKLYSIFDIEAKLRKLLKKPKARFYNYHHELIFHNLKKSIVSGDWGKTKSILNEQTGKKRSILFEQLHADALSPKIFESWVYDQPNEPLALILYSGSLINKAWEARGAGYSDTVTRNGWDNFEECLIKAQRALLKAAKLSPKDPEPWNLLIIVGKGLSLDKKIIWEYFVQLIKRDSDHYFGHSNMIDLLTPKWLGSKDELLAFTRSVTKSLDPGNILHGLIAQAFIELAWDNMRDEDDDVSIYDGFSDPVIVKQITESYDKCFPSLPKSPDYVESSVLNCFAFCFYCAQEEERAREILKKIKFRGIEYPWYIGLKTDLSFLDPLLGFDEVCKNLDVV